MIEIYGVIFSIRDIILLSLFGLALLIQLFYLLLIAIFLQNAKKRVTTDHYPPVSVIITSRNYEDNLKKILPDLLEQNYPDFQIVVVNDCSTDGTEWYLSGLKLQYPHLKTTRIIQETDFPNALAITVGIRAASKVWLIFLNPLCVVPDRNWLKSYAKNLLPEKEVIYGYVTLLNYKGLIYNLLRFEIFDSYILSGAARSIGLPMPVMDINIAYKRKEFLERRGFAAVLESPFRENELYVNKISNRDNTSYIMNRYASIGYSDESNWHDLMNFKKKQLLLKQKFTVGQRYYLWLNTNSRLAFDILMVIIAFLSPWRLWGVGIWLFKNIIEMIFGIIAMQRLGEKKLFPGVSLFKSVSPIINSFVLVNQLFIGNRRKWK